MFCVKAIFNPFFANWGLDRRVLDEKYPCLSNFQKEDMRRLVVLICLGWMAALSAGPKHSCDGGYLSKRGRLKTSK